MIRISCEVAKENGWDLNRSGEKKAAAAEEEVCPGEESEAGLDGLWYGLQPAFNVAGGGNEEVLQFYLGEAPITAAT